MVVVGDVGDVVDVVDVVDVIAPLHQHSITTQRSSGGSPASCHTGSSSI